MEETSLLLLELFNQSAEPLFVVPFSVLSTLSLCQLFNMHFSALVSIAFTFASLANAQTQYTKTDKAAVAAARATARTLSPTSSVKGKKFDRFVTIWLENTDFELAAGDRRFSFCLPLPPPC